jgi:hypothetical protein
MSFIIIKMPPLPALDAPALRAGVVFDQSPITYGPKTPGSSSKLQLSFRSNPAPARSMMRPASDRESQNESL